MESDSAHPAWDFSAAPGAQARWHGWLDTHRALVAAAVLLLYVASAWLTWGHWLLGHWTTWYLGAGSDAPDIFMWSLRWWPYAIRHGQDPWVLRHVFGSYTVNSGWVTTVPLLSLLAAPITLTAGATAAYNVMALAAPVLTAWTTYLLIRELTHYDAVAVWAGWLVGWSGYEVVQTYGGHLNLTMLALVPLAALAVVRIYRWRGPRLPWGPTLALAATLVGQFLVSTEVLATMTLVGGVVLAILAVRPGWRATLWHVLPAIASAYALALLVLSGWVIGMLQHIPTILVANQDVFATNLLNLVLPNAATVGGAAVLHLTRRFAGGDPAEQSGYLGVALVALTALAAVRLRRTGRWKPAGVATATLIVVVVASLGPTLQSNGLLPAWPLPWQLVRSLPLVNIVIPDRLMIYAVWIAAGLVSVYLIQPHPHRMRHDFLVLAMGLAVVLLLPNRSRTFWTTPLATPALLTSPHLTAVIPAHDVVLVLPYFHDGLSTYFQERSNFQLSLADGYLFESVPRPWSTLPITRTLAAGMYPTTRHAVAQFRTLLALGRVNLVLYPVGSRVRAALLTRAGLDRLGQFGGVVLWSVPSGLLGRPHRVASGT